MKLNILFIMAVLIIGNSANAAEWKIIHAGTLIDIPGEEVKSRMSIILRDNIIVDVKAGYVEKENIEAVNTDTVEIVNLQDQVVMPGLIDTHVHLSGELSDFSRMKYIQYEQDDYAIEGVVFAKKTLMAGFTTVRNPGGEHAMFAVRDAVNAGKVIGPRILNGGNIISATGGHGQRSGYMEPIVAYFQNNDDGLCDGIESCRRAVRSQVRKGADVIKIATTGGVLTDSDSGTGQQFTLEEVKTIVDIAHMLGKKVAAHAHAADGVVIALEAGVDSIEHGSYIDDRAIELFKKTNAFLVPTLMAGDYLMEEAVKGGYTPAITKKALEVSPQMQVSFAKAYKAGVRIAMGTDSGVSKHGQNAKEFELMVGAGMTTKDALISTTINAAELLGMSDKVGTIEVGKFADIVATKVNPYEDIKTLKDVLFVMKDGIIYKGK